MVTDNSPLTVLRRALAVVAIVVFLVAAYFTTRRYINTSKYFSPNNPTIIRNSVYNDLTDGTMQAKLTLSSNMFQVGLLVIAALGGLIIAKRDEASVVLADAPEIVMLSCAGLLILASFVCYVLYVNEITYIYYVAGQLFDEKTPSVPDILDENISYLSKYQFWYLLFGIVLATFTFISAHNLKGGKKS